MSLCSNHCPLHQCFYMEYLWLIFLRIFFSKTVECLWVSNNPVGVWVWLLHCRRNCQANGNPSPKIFFFETWFQAELRHITRLRMSYNFWFPDSSFWMLAVTDTYHQAQFYVVLETEPRTLHIPGTYSINWAIHHPPGLSTILENLRNYLTRHMG